jgi:hypothetical protein
VPGGNIGETVAIFEQVSLGKQLESGLVCAMECIYRE